MLKNLFLVGAGGFLGSILRFLLSISVLAGSGQILFS